jgi:hypothetical protein
MRRRCAMCHDTEEVTRIATYDAAWAIAPEHEPYIAKATIDLCDDCAYRADAQPA